MPPRKRHPPVTHSYNLRSRPQDQQPSKAPSPKSRATEGEPARARRKNTEPKHCPICVDAEDFRQHRKTPCGHSFHVKCLNRWLKVSNSCPVCRAVLRKAEPEPERPAQSSAADDSSSIREEIEGRLLVLLLFRQAGLI